VMNSVIVAALMMVLFVYVFGGAINVNDFNYVDFIVPGVLIQCIAQGAAPVAININHDLKGGVVERFRSLNIAKSSFLIGHVAAATFTITVVIGVALLMGFRPQASFLDWLSILALLFLFVIAMTWLAIIFGLMASSPEAASAFMIVSVIPYLSSGFVPTETMPKFVRFFAENQPMTPMINTLRGLMLDGPTTDLPLALLWIFGIIALSWIFAVILYNKKTNF